jgi:hypothetical protein
MTGIIIETKIKEAVLALVIAEMEAINPNARSVGLMMPNTMKYQ